MEARRFIGCAFVVVAILSTACTDRVSEFQRVEDFNFGWRFQLLEDTTALAKVPLNDENWRVLRLPHDWSVETSFDSTLEGCTGYLPGGVGVYQKHFKSRADKNEISTYILFDGVYNNSKFWINGKYIGENPYGYSPVYFDITEYLNDKSEDNVATVHVDHSRYADSRWYTGSGIYRNVKLVTVPKTHIPVWGTFITTSEVSEDRATVRQETKVINQSDTQISITLKTVLLDASEKEVAQSEEVILLSAASEKYVHQTFEVTNPKLWDTDHPNMYKSLTTVVQNGAPIDQYITPFGIRSLVFDKEKGFFLNGKSTYVKGVCLHHDGGLVGAAVPKGVWKRRLEKLKEAGCNAIRTAHNPFSDEFLDLCDEMGFLVQNELFDEMDHPKDKRLNLHERSEDYITRGYTEHFQEWGESDLKRTMLRDRNHPSVFQWSIGNEIEWTYEHYKQVSGFWDPEINGNYWNKLPHLTADEMKSRYENLPDREYKLTETAQRLAGWVKEVDTTRPVTANLILPVASCASGYADALDLVGFSYQVEQYNWCKKYYPHMHFTGHENSGYLNEWKHVIENPMVFSMYMWTGIDYIGESHHKWPRKGWQGDMLDFAGFEKVGWHNFKSIWVNEPHLSIWTRLLEGSKFVVDELSGKPLSKSGKTVNWDNFTSREHWNYIKGEMILVEVSSNLPVVELFLNGESLGSRGMSECPDRIFRWAVPFTEGTLVAKGGFDGSEVTTDLKTASKPVGLFLKTDKTELKADGYDVAHLIVQLVDKDGLPVKTRNEVVRFGIEGEARLLGVDNGSNTSTQDYQSNEIFTDQGRCLAIIQSNVNPGKLTVKATAEGYDSQSISIKVKEKM